MRHVTSLFDLSNKDLRVVLRLAEKLKRDYKRGERTELLPGRVLGLLFEKPSLRTRVSFETGMCHLGGSSLFLGDDVGWGERESIKDFAEVLSRFVDAIVCRAKSHDAVVQLARHSRCPIINGLTDLFHPCQALADLQTIHEREGGFGGHLVAYLGDSNNVARSLVTACGHVDMPIVVASPDGYTFDQPFLDKLREMVPKVRLTQTEDPLEAVRNASVVYTDVWASMGQESEQAERAEVLSRYQVNANVMAAARPDAIFLHCLPAHRGMEVTADVIDGPQSCVYEQAENRMHAQKGLLAWLLGPGG